MKTESRASAFFNRLVEYLRNPNAKNEAAMFGSRGAEQAARAALNRAVRHQRLSSVRRNTRGLPVGVGVHQLRAAKRIKNAIATRPDEIVIGETRLHAAETTIDAIKRNAQARAQHRRPSKLARRMAALR